MKGYTELQGFERWFENNEFDAEEIEKADFERCWNAAIEHACQKIDGVWCCSHDLKSILRTGKGTCTQ